MLGQLHIVPMIAYASSEVRGDVSLKQRPAKSSLLLECPEAVVRVVGDAARVAIGGFGEAPNGWTSPIMTAFAKSEAEIRFEWSAGDKRAVHVVKFDLLNLGRAERPFWTMDASYWSLAGYAEHRACDVADRRRVMAIGAFSEADMPRRHERTFVRGWSDGAFVVEERLTLHAIDREVLLDVSRRRRSAAAQTVNQYPLREAS